jgi:hypothetical protein
MPYGQGLKARLPEAVLELSDIAVTLLQRESAVHDRLCFTSAVMEVLCALLLIIGLNFESCLFARSCVRGRY